MTLIDHQLRLIGARIAGRDGDTSTSTFEYRVVKRLIHRICRPIRDPIAAETMRAALLDAHANLAAAQALGIDQDRIVAMENDLISLVSEVQARAKRDMH